MKVIVVTVALLFAAPAWSICVKVSKANLREKPSAKAPISWVVGRYMPLLELDRKGSWVHVKDLEGEKHWIYAPLITYKYKCAVVKTKKANLRLKPGGNAPLANPSFADLYTPLKRIDSEGPWYKVVTNQGVTVWVHETQVWRPVRLARISF